MTDNDTLYGQHSTQTLVLITIFCLVLGLAVAVFAIPENALPFWQRMGLGASMGVWGGWCVYGWRVLFSEGEEEEQ